MCIKEFPTSRSSDIVGRLSASASVETSVTSRQAWRPSSESGGHLPPRTCRHASPGNGRCRRRAGGGGSGMRADVRRGIRLHVELHQLRHLHRAEADVKLVLAAVVQHRSKDVLVAMAAAWAAQHRGRMRRRSRSAHRAPDRLRSAAGASRTSGSGGKRWTSCTRTCVGKGEPSCPRPPRWCFQCPLPFQAVGSMLCPTGDVAVKTP